MTVYAPPKHNKLIQLFPRQPKKSGKRLKQSQRQPFKNISQGAANKNLSKHISYELICTERALLAAYRQSVSLGPTAPQAAAHMRRQPQGRWQHSSSTAVPQGMTPAGFSAPGSGERCKYSALMSEGNKLFPFALRVTLLPSHSG